MASPHGHLTGIPAPRRAHHVAQAVVEVMTAQGYVRSEHPAAYSDPGKGRSRRLAGQFWYALRLIECRLISRTADSRWEMEIHFAHVPSTGRNDPDFGQLEIGTQIEDLIVALAQDLTLSKDDMSIRSGGGEWIDVTDDSGYWDCTLAVEFQVPRRTD